MNKYQVFFILSIVFFVLAVIFTIVVFIHGSTPNLTDMQRMNDCTREIVGNCSFIP